VAAHFQVSELQRDVLLEKGSWKESTSTHAPRKRTSCSIHPLAD